MGFKLTIWLSLLPFFLIAQSTKVDDSNHIANKVQEYALTYLQEKVYVTTDKPYYALGDTIWFQTFLVNALNHQPLTLSNTVYVDLLDSEGKVLISRILHSINGNAPGDFVIGDKWSPGLYQIRAFTKWQQNFSDEFLFQKVIDVYDIWPMQSESLDSLLSVDESEFSEKPLQKSPEVEIRLFPEGGNLVGGVTTIVGLKSTIAGTEEPISVKGTVYDVRTDKTLASFDSDEYGLGAFVFRTSGSLYGIRLDSPRFDLRYEIAPVEFGSYSLKVGHSPGSSVVRVVVETDMPGALRGASLIGHVRGQVFCSVQIDEANDKKQKLITIPTHLIPTGIAHFTLFEPKGKPRAERLIFVDQGDMLVHAYINTDKNSFAKRERVDMEIKLEDKLAGQATVSITNSLAIERDSGHMNLCSYLILQSDLRGVVKDPSSYLFGNDKIEIHKRLDCLLLTHGWRRFSWDDVLDTVYTSLPIEAERGITFSGQLNNYTIRSKPKAGHVQLVSMRMKEDNLTGLSVETIKTDESGEFMFNNLYYQDSVKIILQAKKNENKEGFKYFIDLDEIDPPATTSVSMFHYDEVSKQSFIEYANKAYVIEKSFGNDVIMLEAVSVEEKVQNPHNEVKSNLYGFPDYRMVPDSLAIQPIYVIDLIRMIPGVRLDQNNMPLIRNMSVTFFLDGFEIDSSFANSMLLGTPASDIYFIDVERNGFSNGRGNPILYIYTKSGNGILTPVERDNLPGILHMYHPGYYQARQFYAPNYGADALRSAKPDYRLQLYWNPAVNVVDGQAKVSFYVGDDVAGYDVVVEGLSRDGKVIMGTQQITVGEN